MAQRLISEASVCEQKGPHGYSLCKAKWPRGRVGRGKEDLDLGSPKPLLTADSKGGPWEQRFTEGHLSSFEAAYISAHRRAPRPESP